MDQGLAACSFTRLDGTHCQTLGMHRTQFSSHAHCKLSLQVGKVAHLCSDSQQRIYKSRSYNTYSQYTIIHHHRRKHFWTLQYLPHQRAFTIYDAVIYGKHRYENCNSGNFGTHQKFWGTSLSLNHEFSAGRHWLPPKQISNHCIDI